jgi:hypothetical protein
MSDAADVIRLLIFTEIGDASFSNARRMGDGDTAAGDGAVGRSGIER